MSPEPPSSRGPGWAESPLSFPGHGQEPQRGASRRGGASAGAAGPGELLQPHLQQPRRHRGLAAEGRGGCLRAHRGTAAWHQPCSAFPVPPAPRCKAGHRGSPALGYYFPSPLSKARPQPAAPGTAQLRPGRGRQWDRAAPRASPSCFSRSECSERLMSLRGRPAAAGKPLISGARGLRGRAARCFPSPAAPRQLPRPQAAGRDVGTPWVCPTWGRSCWGRGFCAAAAMSKEGVCGGKAPLGCPDPLPALVV